MEFKIKCPDCGKELAVKVSEVAKAPDTLVNLTIKNTTSRTWREIAHYVRTDAKGNFKVGDELSCTLKNGLEVTFVVAAINPYAENEVAFVIKDCLPIRHAMNSRLTNKGGWAMSDMRKYLNTEILRLLPDDLVEVIKPRTIIQLINGEDFKATDKLQILSYTEVFGGDCYMETDKCDVHFPLFKDERSRVKQNDGETCWYPLRTPTKSSSANFCIVNSNGNAFNNIATYGYSIAFSFFI